MKHKTFLACSIICTSMLTAAFLSGASAQTVPQLAHSNSFCITPPEAKPYDSLIHYYANQYHVPLPLAYGVIHTESNYNCMAHGKAGEIGLMQLMPATARGLGFKGPLNQLYNPRINLQYGMRYLAQAEHLGHGDLCRTILKYNAGANAKSMNPVSARYCATVKSYIANL